MRVAVLYGCGATSCWHCGGTTSTSRPGRYGSTRVAVGNGMVWIEGKSERSRRRLALDADRRARASWPGDPSFPATSTGRCACSSTSRHLSSHLAQAPAHGRHPQVRSASDVGELRAAAEILGHSSDMLMRIYAHTLPESIRTVTEKIGQRGRPSGVTDE